MLKRLFPLFLILLLSLSACGTQQEQMGESGETSLSIVATTYPIYLFASEVTKGVEGITVSPLINQQISCLHNYTLTVNDMKLLESADLVFMNGAGLDSFLLDASLSNQNRLIVDCSLEIPLLDLGPHHHDESLEATQHEESQGDKDPHYWMDPERAAMVLETISNELCELDPNHEEQYRSNCTAASSLLLETKDAMAETLSPLLCRELITFHDGFSYFADAFDLTILMAIEEEEGQEASAQVISEAITLIQGYGLPAIFTELHSSDATAKAISHEANVKVYPLSMIMSGETETSGIESYLTAMQENVNTILEALQ